MKPRTQLSSLRRHSTLSTLAASSFIHIKKLANKPKIPTSTGIYTYKYILVQGM